MSPSSPSPSPARPRRLPYVLATLLLATIALLVPALPASAAEADTVYSLLNDARVANGQSALVRSASLDQVAVAWAAQLSAAGVLSHNPDYPTQIPAGWSEAGENVAEGQLNAADMHVAWMNSDGHRANILGNYTHVGIAWLTDASGRTWGVEVFANYPAAPMEEVATPTLADVPAPRFTRSSDGSSAGGSARHEAQPPATTTLRNDPMPSIVVTTVWPDAR